MLNHQPRKLTMLPAAFLLSVSLASTSDTTSSTPGSRVPTAAGVTETTSALMQRQASAPDTPPPVIPVFQLPDRSGLPQNPAALEVASYPVPARDTNKASERNPVSRRSIHSTGAAFDGATLADTALAFPPDTMGAAGPTQFIAFVKGRIRSFTKAGAPDGVLNADPSVFFAPVITPVAGPVLSVSTRNPQIRYDRFTSRWFLSLIDVPCTDAGCTTTTANRWLLAVSDAASAGVISGSTVWTLFQFQTNPGTNLLVDASLGIDVNALYVGGNLRDSAGAFLATNGYVVQKTSVLGAGPAVVTAFPNLAIGAGAGPKSPRGVDSFDPAATEGYFVGPDNSSLGTIIFRRVTNPGTLTPTISADISVGVATTTTPNPIEHLGNSGGVNGNLSSLDDRLFAAMIRNGRLWTAHNFRVDNTGVASVAAESRNAVRWYEFQNLTTTPTVVQSGTVFDNSATRAASLQYFIPSIAATGQGHAVMGFTMAGAPVGATPAYVGRLAGDVLGTMVGPPISPAVTFGTTTANYNPPGDAGGPPGRRWGSYSFTVVDPIDDMTVWTIQEYNQALNSYAVRVGRLTAPPPATPTCSGTPIVFPGPTGNVVINATSSAGSGFYDPGTNLPPPAQPFNHLTANVTGAIVNSVTYNSPIQVTLNVTATATGLRDVTLTNPDGQLVTANGCINAQTAAAVDLTLAKSDGGATVAPGGTVAYTLTYGNAGLLPASGVVLTETVPANTTFNAGASTAGWVCTPNDNSGSTCTLAIGGVPAATGPLTATYAVTVANPVPAGVLAINNTATIADDGTHGADATPGNNAASDNTPVLAFPDLSLTKDDGGASVSPGGTVAYTLTYANSGNRGASGVVLTDVVPANAVFNAGASTAGWVCSPNNNPGSSCTLAVGTVAAGGGNQTATFAVTVLNPVGAGVLQIANAAGIADDGTNGTDPTPGNNTGSDTTPVTAAPDLSITKDDGGVGVAPGGTVAYTLTYANSGNRGATGVTLTDVVPANTTFNAGASTAGWACAPDNNPGSNCTFAVVGALAAGSGPQTVTYAVTVANPVPPGVSQINNVAGISDDNANGIDPNPGNNTGGDTTPVTAAPELSLTKSDGGAKVTPAGTVAYILTYANTGNAGATGVTLTETVPANTTFNAGASTAGWICAPNVNAGSICTFPVGAVPAGSPPQTAAFAVQLAIFVPPGVTQVSNTASIADDGANGTDPNPGNNTASDTTPIHFGGAGSIMTANSPAPAATLLLPYFQVDLNNPNGITTLLSINNATFTAVLAHVTLWSDLGVPTFAFNVYLTGYDVHTINVRDVFNGTIPRTASAGQDPTDTISHKGPFSQDINFASCSGQLPLPPLPAIYVTHLRAAHQGQGSAFFSGQCSGIAYGDGIARGYITVDTVNTCTTRLPNQAGYFGAGGTGDVANQNVLWGDYFYVNPTQNSAQGDALVHIKADATDPLTSTPGRYTFYGRLVNWTAIDNRQPLPTNFAARFINGGAFNGGTRLDIWRDPKVDQGSFNCPATPGVRPAWYPLGQEGIVIFDEQENPTVVPQPPFSPPPPQSGMIPAPAAATNVQVGGPTFPVAFPFGWLYLNLNTIVNAAGSVPPTDPAASQAWVVMEHSALGRFSVGYGAVPLDSGTAARHSVPH